MRTAFALLLLTGAASAQEPSFEALGQVTVVGGDRVKARDRALDDALRQAVEQGVATVLDPQALVARSSELRLRVYPKARSYVENYRILDEGETSGVFQVHVSAQVATGRLARDLAAPAPAVSPVASVKGRAVVCSRGSAAVERVAKEALAARGVELAPPPPTCSDEVAARAAQAAGAQGALVGSDETAPDGAIRGTELVAARSKVTLHLVEPSGHVAADGAAEKIAYQTTPAGAADEAAHAAATEASRALQPALASRWPGEQKTVSGGLPVHIGGISRYPDYTALLRALSSLPGVERVEPRRFARGEADLLVRTASSAPQLAAALDRAPPSGLRVTATAADGGLKLDVAAVPAPDGG